ncbi:MAG: succinate dehydrogenase, cytochrome b556 subunit [Rhodocyclaceae bacterium]|nr:succinate dehydrogenase, cytochrome b556 subunit [Rhodocyclaceae bacterium]
MSEMRKKRPKYLNLFQIKLPLPGVVSFMHRVSGAGLFILLPLILWLFTASLGTPASFLDFKAVAGNLLVKLFLLAALAGYCYHFCAGIRFLFMDMNMGVDLPAARRSSVMVIAGAAILTLAIGVKLW